MQKKIDYKALYKAEQEAHEKTRREFTLFRELVRPLLELIDPIEKLVEIYKPYMDEQEAESKKAG